MGSFLCNPPQTVIVLMVRLTRGTGTMSSLKRQFRLMPRDFNWVEFESRVL